MAELESTLSFFLLLCLFISLSVLPSLSYPPPPPPFPASPCFLSKELAKVLCPAEVPLSETQASTMHVSVISVQVTLFIGATTNKVLGGSWGYTRVGCTL